MQAIATWRKGHAILLEDGRAHSVLVDQPPDEGGTSAGTTPRELALLSLAGSLATTFVSLARKRHLDFSGLTLVLEGEVVTPSVDPNGIHGTLRLRSHADRTTVEAVLREAVDTCPVSRVFRAAQIPVSVMVAIAAGNRP